MTGRSVSSPGRHDTLWCVDKAVGTPLAHKPGEWQREGGAFINWRGEVHPCYFTWHRYACYINDRKKYVQPKVFGNLATDAMAAICNRSDYRGFRERVLSYEYPYCGNCTFAPCDYIGTDIFTHDCHTFDVPFGDCPWCDGLLQCLQ